MNNNSIWLGSAKKERVKQKDHLKLWVNRLISDGHPMEMKVSIHLEVAGQSREVKLTQFSTEKFQLMRVQSPLNSQLNSHGDFIVQLKPGTHYINLYFKIHGFPENVTFDQKGQF